MIRGSGEPRLREANSVEFIKEWDAGTGQCLKTHNKVNESGNKGTGELLPFLFIFLLGDFWPQYEKSAFILIDLFQEFAVETGYQFPGIGALDFTIAKSAGNGPANPPTGLPLIDTVVLIG